MTDWNIKTIAEWHKSTFPDATWESQLLKLDEELEEVIEAQLAREFEQSYNELADVYIVACSLKERFNSTIGSYFVGLIEENPAPDMQARIDKKMNENLKRKWGFKNGVYRHVDKKGD